MTSNKFLHPDGSYWLVSELVKKFLDDGHEVTVLNFYWAGAEEPNADFVGHPRLTLINLNPFKNGGVLMLFSRWFLSSFKFYPALLRMLIKKQQFDLFISFSPAFPFWSLIPLGHMLSRKSLLIYWDFFPIHNFKIKKPWFKIVYLFVFLIVLQQSLVKQLKTTHILLIVICFVITLDYLYLNSMRDKCKKLIDENENKK